MEYIPKGAQAVGYQWLINHFKLIVIPYFRSSYLIDDGSTRSFKDIRQIIYLYDQSYALTNSQDPLEHLIFALKHEGLSLEIIAAIFTHIPSETIQAYIAQQPTGQYQRILWYLFEKLMHTKLAIPDLQPETYINLLNPEEYYTCSPIPEPRYGINDNLLGNIAFCPIVRKTDHLQGIEQKHLDRVTRDIIQPYDQHILNQVCNALYSQEMLASFDIGKNRPHQQRIDHTIEFIKQQNKLSALSETILITLQNNLVDEKRINQAYRITQNYIGRERDLKHQTITYISPKPNVVHELMTGLLASLERMITSQVHPIVIATTLSFGLLYIHPFHDGNGRLHRFLINYVLHRTNFFPIDLIIPISAVMFAHLQKYDQILRYFIVTPLITDYNVNNEGILTVHQETTHFYRYVDYTIETEYIAACIEESIQVNLKNELVYQTKFDATKKELEKIVNIPDKIDLFITLVTQNNGKLSKGKRKAQFAMLTDDDVNRMELVVQNIMMKSEEQ